MIVRIPAAPVDDPVAMVNEKRIGAIFQEQTHDIGFRVSSGEPERRRSDEFRFEVVVARGTPGRGPVSERSAGVCAMRKQRGYHFLVTAHDRFVKRGEAGFSRVRVSALLEQKV